MFKAMAYPRLWGDLTWGVLHNLAACIDIMPQHEEAHFAFLGMLCSLPAILPCSVCRVNATPICYKRLSSRRIPNSLVTLMHSIHNDVNKHLDKPLMELEVAENRACQMRQLDTNQLWRFLIVILRCIDQENLSAMLSFGTCLAKVVGDIGHDDLAMAIVYILQEMRESGSDDTLQIIYPLYKQWCKNHLLPCYETMDDFVQDHAI